MEVSHGVLSTKYIGNGNGKSYVITGTDGYLETIVNSQQTLFPIGTAKSYNPIEIKLDKDHPLRTLPFEV
jgi:hypothetical protein